jgi:hypothetical protein
MSRREIVLLVSRAIAALTLIQAFNTLLVYLRLLILFLTQQFPIRSSNMPKELIFEFARLLLMFLIGVLFWRCGPTVERFLLPAGTQQKSDASV